MPPSSATGQPADLNRKVGVLFAIVFLVVAFYPAVQGGLHWGAVRPWSVALAAGLAVVAALAPALLAPLARAWMGLSALLHRVVNPMVLGVLFFGLVTPVALVRRWRGGGTIPLGFDRGAPTYWKTRSPPGPDPATLSRQY